MQCQIFLFFLCASVLQAFSLSILKSFALKNKDCLHQLTSDFLIQQILTTVYAFVYVHIGFWILTLAIRSILTTVYLFLYHVDT